mgnify:CR=1 FL=1
MAEVLVDREGEFTMGFDLRCSASGTALLAASFGALLVFAPVPRADAAVIGGVNLGNLTDYLFFFSNGSDDANWQGSSKGYVGDVAVDGIEAVERTSGTVPYAGTIVTNDDPLGVWQDIVADNPGQASANLGQGATISGLETDLSNAFTSINGLSATAGFSNRSAASLNTLDTQNGLAETFVINITSGFSGISSLINITGDSDDAFILRWDDDLATAGYQGQVKFQSGGGINPLGGLTAANFVHVAGNINASGGGSNPSGLAGPLAEIDAINGGTAVNGGGFFTGYWLTTGDPSNGDNASLSNAIFVGGWYTTADKFSLTSGTSGVHVPPPESVDEGATLGLLGLGLAGIGLAARRRARL